MLVYQAGFPVSELNWYDRTRRAVGAVGRPAPYAGAVRISPDGQRVAAAVWSPENGAWDVWAFDVNGRESRRLTFPPASHGRPVWSPDGTRVALGTSQTGPPHLAILETAEAGKEQAVARELSPTQAPDQIQLPTDWSRDGRFIAFDTGLGQEEQEVWLADAATGKAMPFLHNEFAQCVDTNNWLYAVPVKGPLRFGEPQRLFRIAGTPQYGTTTDFQFDVTPDGRRFIMSTTGSVTPPPFVVVENWQDKFRN